MVSDLRRALSETAAKLVPEAVEKVVSDSMTSAEVIWEAKAIELDVPDVTCDRETATVFTRLELWLSVACEV